MNSAAEVASHVAQWIMQGVTKADLICLIAEDMLGWPYAWGATGQKCTVKNREARMKNSKISEGDINLIKKRCQVLSGKASVCSGCKYYPDGEVTEIHDCIGFINDLLTQAGIYHYGAGCTFMWNHEKNWSTKGKLANIPETVCLVFQQKKGEPNKMEHIGLYLGNGYVIHCSVEVKKQKLSEYPWTHFAILRDLGGDVPVTHETIRRGSTGPDVVECQEDLIKLGYDLGAYGADGKFGKKTEDAVKAFQSTHTDPRTGDPLKVDGVVGKGTWAALDEAVGPQPGPEPPITELYTVTIPHLTAAQADAILAQYPNGTKEKEEGG